MNRFLVRAVVAVACVVALPHVAAAQDPTLFGSYELRGKDAPQQRPVAVALRVEGANVTSVTVTRTARIYSKTTTWTSSDVWMQGRYMRVRFAVKSGGFGDVLNGGFVVTHRFEATYLLGADGIAISERVKNLTQKKPHADWWSMETSGKRTVAGTTTLPDLAAFDRFARRDDVPGATSIREVKLLMVGADSLAPKLWLIDTKRHAYHYDFATRSLGQAVSLEEFNRITYFTDARKNVAGTLLYHESYTWPDGKKGLVALEFWPTDPVRVKHVAAVFHAAVKALPFAGTRLAYHPAGETQEALYAQEKATFDQQKVRVVTTADLMGGLTYQALNLGVGFGVLRVIDTSVPDPRPPSVRDVVIFKRIPNDLSHTGGIMTEEPQTPLSHVNLKAKQNKTPNAYVKAASTNPRIAPLIGKVVRFEVGPDDFSIREATAAEAEQFLEALRPKAVQYPPRDLSAKEITKLAQLGHASSDSFGAKASNVAELRKLLGGAIVPDGFGVPFWFYDEFMKANGLYDKARTMIAAPAFKTDPAARETALADFRKTIKKAPIPPALAQKLRAMQATFPAGTPIRCRSSTNNEDLPGFNGAGLYDSYTHRPDEGEIDKTMKQVWASLWNYRAFEERDFYRIDHFTAAMGVLCHPNFDDELANGVAITRNVFDPNWPGYYVNAQVGESLITNPDGSRPDEFLVSRIGPNNEYEVQYVQRSNQVPTGKTVLTSAQIRELAAALGKIQDHFRPLYGAQKDPRFAMDVEWKFDKDARLVVKQARPVVD